MPDSSNTKVLAGQRTSPRSMKRKHPSLSFLPSVPPKPLPTRSVIFLRSYKVRVDHAGDPDAILLMNRKHPRLAHERTGSGNETTELEAGELWG